MVMIKTNVAEAKAKLSEYLDRALAGERVVICRHNAPVAELRPIGATRDEPRPIGPLPGRPSFDVPPAFFEPLADEELDRWEGASMDWTARSRPAAPRVAATRPPDGGGGKGTKSRRRP